MSHPNVLHFTAANRSGSIFTAGSGPVLPAAARSIRIAHLTDIHLQPERGAPDILAACFRQLHTLADKPDLIINGGDVIMDALEQSQTRVKQQWDLWQSIIRNENDLEWIHCIGNHDVWGLKGAERDPGYGKKWVMEVLGMDRAYYSFDHSGWHFIVLDSTRTTAGGTWYEARLDEAQAAWLAADLASIALTVPICIISHIPIVSAAVFFDGDNVKNGRWEVPGGWMHLDAPELVELFCQYRNIRLCISGHIHLFDSVQYNGITYICGGAVCGKWWEGHYRQTPPGYGLLDLYDDGNFYYDYRAY